MYKFQIGDRCRIKAGNGAHTGKLATVVAELAVRICNSEANPHKYARKLCYKIAIDGEDGDSRTALPDVIELMPPSTRGDLDVKASWESLPAEVVKAMKHGPN